MRILQILTSLQLGGAEILVHDLVVHWKRQGWEMDVAVLRRTGSALESSLESSGVRVMHTGVERLYSLMHVKQLAQMMSGYDVVHAHLFPTQLFAAAAQRFGANKPRLLTTEHSTDNHRRHWPWYRPVDEWTYRQYETIVCISDATAEAMRAWAPQSSPRLRIIHNGVSIAKFRDAETADKKAVIGTDAPVVLMVGRFEGPKNHACAVGAMTRLPDAHLVLVGEGPLRAQTEKLARTFGVEERVHFLGYRADVPQLLRMADVYIQPSKWEGFGLAALEAMAAGVPVVASNVPGLASIVGGAGVLVPADEAELLADEVQELLRSPERRVALARAGSQRAREYTLERTAEEYAALYRASAAVSAR